MGFSPRRYTEIGLLARPYHSGQVVTAHAGVGVGEERLVVAAQVVFETKI
jgi:hypothetical protein